MRRARLLVAIAIGFIAVLAIRTGFNLYIIAIALGLVSFLATVAFARFDMRQGMEGGRTGGGRRKLIRKGVRQGKATRARRRR
ncbi:MAG: monovalent cation/H+ antiporter complex subunit F [Shinella sp.]|nr:monovalent cation/H+ antiporter complex subunit F [Shinella sp.]MCO5136260.1 monovalent cation/H+ antiporter complex subunit F [Shinella sp.]